tara:strand:+ start:99 stop:506 length:408 start_codon:yes stop_codon:yes gene_type:complete
MSILTNIDGIPLYSNITSAIAWAKSYGLTGYHVHVFQGQVGYMGGIDHSESTKRFIARKQQELRKPAQREKQQVEQVQQQEQQSEVVIEQPQVQQQIQPPPPIPQQSQVQVTQTPTYTTGSSGVSSGGSSGGGGY